jgi:hypothetical protein
MSVALALVWQRLAIARRSKLSRSRSPWEAKYNYAAKNMPSKRLLRANGLSCAAVRMGWKLISALSGPFCGAGRPVR